MIWENRGQTEFGASYTDVAGEGKIVVASGAVNDEAFNAQWFLRAIDVQTGHTKWEDRFGPVIFGLAKDVVVNQGRAFAAGWILSPDPTVLFDFVARGYDLENGAVLWSHVIDRGPFFDTAKVVTTEGERVYVGGYLTGQSGTAAATVLAFDAASGATVWESILEPMQSGGTGDAVWAIAVKGKTVFALVETSSPQGLLLRAFNATTGALEWQHALPGANNFALEDTLLVQGNRVIVAGTDQNGDFMVRAFDTISGQPRWSDHVDDGTMLGQAEAITATDRGLYVVGVAGCDPLTFVDCELIIRAYATESGNLLWERVDLARGGDWGYPLHIAADHKNVYFGGTERLLDGDYHPLVRSLDAINGTLQWEEAFAPDSEPPGFASVFVIDRRLFIEGTIFRPDFSSDAVLKLYRSP